MVAEENRVQDDSGSEATTVSRGSTRYANEDFDLSESQSDEDSSPSISDFHFTVHESICRDVWFRLGLESKLESDFFIPPNCGNAHCRHRRDIRGRPFPLAPLEDVLEFYLKQVTEQGMSMAVIIPDMPNQKWFQTAMAYSSKTYHYGPDRNVLRDVSQHKSGYWAVLVNGELEPNPYQSTGKRLRTKTAERRWRRKFKSTRIA
jgi:hypothetical protein